MGITANCLAIDLEASQRLIETGGLRYDLVLWLSRVLVPIGKAIG